MSPHHVVLVRHGATDWSQAGRHTGWTDLPLNGDGLAPGARAGATAGAWSFELVLCSPLQRAVTTCQRAGRATSPSSTPTCASGTTATTRAGRPREIRERPRVEHLGQRRGRRRDARGGGARADRVVERCAGSTGRRRLRPRSPPARAGGAVDRPARPAGRLPQPLHGELSTLALGARLAVDHPLERRRPTSATRLTRRDRRRRRGASAGGPRQRRSPARAPARRPNSATLRASGGATSSGPMLPAWSTARMARYPWF